MSAAAAQRCAQDSGAPNKVPLFDVILIETQNDCTRSCWFCKFGQQRQDAAHLRMSWATIERIVGNLRDLDYRGRVSWFWINEPLLDSRIIEIVARTRQACPHAFLSLITNGDLLDETLYRALRRSGLDAIGISVYDNPAADRARRLKRDDRMVLLDMRRTRPPALENRGGNVKRHATLFAETQLRLAKSSCGRPFRMMTVNARGQAVLCCSDLYSDVVMGDVATERLEDIWNNPSFARYRTQLAAHGREELPLCSSCSYQGGASTVHYPLPARPERTEARSE